MLCCIGSDSIEPAKLLLLARGGGVSSSVTSGLEISDPEQFSESEDVGDSLTTSNTEPLSDAVDGGLDTFFCLCMFAMRHRICTYSLSLPFGSGICGGRDILSQFPA